MSPPRGEKKEQYEREFGLRGPLATTQNCKLEWSEDSILTKTKESRGSDLSLIMESLTLRSQTVKKETKA